MKPQAYRTRLARPFATTILVATLVAGAACHPTPTIVKTSTAAIGGTIAGVINGPPDAALSDRAVSLVNVETGQRYETRTGANGGYAIRVPAGTYRVDVELRRGEKLAPEDNTLVLKNGNGEVRPAADVADRQ